MTIVKCIRFELLFFVITLLTSLLIPFSTSAQTDNMSASFFEKDAETLQKEIKHLSTSYQGNQSADLLLLIELINEKVADYGNDLTMTQLDEIQRYVDIKNHLIDMLYEWPSAELSKLILKSLDSKKSQTKIAALEAAIAVANDSRVSSKLWEIAETSSKNGNSKEAILALYALSESQQKGFTQKITPFLASNNNTIQEVAKFAELQNKIRTGTWKMPPMQPANYPLKPVYLLDCKKNLLKNYKSLTSKDASPTDYGLAIMGINKRSRPKAEQLNVLSTILGNNGTVIIFFSDNCKWPKSVRIWAKKMALKLPSKSTHVIGPGKVNYNDFQRFSCYPFMPEDQYGNPTDFGWLKWAKTQRAPIMSASNPQTALAITQQTPGKGKVVFTSINLSKNPVYTENLLRWVYGDSLLAHTFTFPRNTYNFTNTGKTPHQVWGIPLAEKVNVLYLSDDEFKRGLLELNQRLDINYRYVPYDATLTHRSGKKEKEIVIAGMAQRATCLLEQNLSWADILVFDVATKNLLRSLVFEANGQVSLETIPSRLRRRIYRRVHTDKMGLLGSGYYRVPESSLKNFCNRIKTGSQPQITDWQKVIKATIPFSNTPNYTGARGINHLKVAEKGTGRLFWMGQRMPHQDNSPVSEFKLSENYSVPYLLAPYIPVNDAEYWYAFLCKAILWTSGKTTHLYIKDFTCAETTPTSFAKANIAFFTPVKGTLEISIRNSFNQIVNSSKVSIDGKQGKLSLPNLPQGWYILTVIIKDSKGFILDFASRTITVTNPKGIASVSSSKTFYKPNEVAELTVKFKKPTPSPRKLQIKVIDTYDRLVLKKQLTLNADKTDIAFKIPIKHPLSRLWDIEITVIENNITTDTYRKPIGIILPIPEKTFNVTCPVTQPKILTDFFQDTIGTDVTFGFSDRFVRKNFKFAAGSWSSPIGASTTPGVRSKPTEREPCLSSPKFRLKAISDAKKLAPKLEYLGINDYMIDDESPISGRCLASATLFRFRKWLKNKYQTLDAVNKEWGTNYKSWDKLIPLDDATTDKPGSYVDFDLFNHWVFAEYCNFLELVMNDYIPGFKAGQSGGVSDNAMMDQAGYLAYYGVIEPAISVKRKDAVIGSWYAPGYRFVEDHEAQSRYWPWWHLLRGTTRIQIWYPTSGGGAPAYEPDLSRLYNAFKWLKEEMDQIRLGIGKLFLHINRFDGETAILNSQQSGIVINDLKTIAKGSKSEENMFKTLYPKLRSHFQNPVLNQFIECRFISEQLVKKGEIKTRNLKLLFLPNVVSLSPKEQAKLKEFVNAGGILVADLNTGLRNQHGTLIGSQFAEEIFGVTFKEGIDKKDIQLHLTTNGKKRFPELAKSANIQVQTGIGRAVTITDGTPYAEVTDKTGKSPALIIKKHGKGICLFLNFILPKNATFANALAQDLLQIAAVKPVVKVTFKNSPEIGTFGVFNDKQALYYGIAFKGKGGMIETEKPVLFTLTFPEKQYLYDIRNSKFIGQTNQHQVETKPGTAELFASLPYKLEKITIKFNQPDFSPGAVIQVSSKAITVGEKPNLQVWEQTVIAPDGKRQDAYHKLQLVKNGTLNIELPLALNAAKGTWTIHLRDAATGLIGKAKFQVK